MNGTSGFQADCGKLCHARIRGRRLKGQNSEPRTQNSQPSTQHPELRTADRFLHEQRHRLKTGAWHLLHTHPLSALFTDISTKREKAPDTFFGSGGFVVVTTDLGVIG